MKTSTAHKTSRRFIRRWMRRSGIKRPGLQLRLAEDQSGRRMAVLTWSIVVGMKMTERMNRWADYIEEKYGFEKRWH